MHASRKSHLGLGAIALKFVVAAIMLFILAPILVTVSVSVTTAPYLAFPPIGFTWKWFDSAIRNQEFLAGLMLSLKLAVLATLASVVFGSAAAIALYRAGFIGKSIIVGLLLSPLAFPMLVAGIAFLQFFNALQFRSVFWQLLIAHTVITIPYVVRTVAASLQMIDPQIVSAARSLGAGRLETLIKVVLPLSINGVLAGGIFAFVTSFDNFPVSMWLVNAEYRTLPLALFSLVSRFLDPSIAAISSLTIAFSIVLALLVERMVGLRRFATG